MHQPKHTHNPLHLAKAPGYYDYDRPEVIRMLKEQNITPATVIELGCSAGGVGAQMKQAFGTTRYVGVELSAEVAQRARARLDQVLVANVETTLPSALGLGAQEFDLLVALDVLEHLVDPWETLARWVELLKPGGHVIVSLPNIQNIEIIRGLAAGKWEYAEAGLLDVTHLRFFTRQGIEQLIAGAGLRVVRTDSVIPQPMDLSQLQDRGNSVADNNLTLHNLTREQVYGLLTYQYLVIGQKPG